MGAMTAPRPSFRTIDRYEYDGMRGVSKRETHVVLTPDGGCITCSSETDAQRVAADMNAMRDRIALLEREIRAALGELGA